MERRSFATEFWPLDYVQHVLRARTDPLGGPVGIVTTLTIHSDGSITYEVLWCDGSRDHYAGPMLRHAPAQASTDSTTKPA